MPNENFINDINNINYNSAIDVNHNDYIHSLTQTDIELASECFIIKDNDSQKIKYSKAKNQHNLLKLLNHSPEFIDSFTKQIGEKNFLNIIYNTTMFFNYSNLLHRLLKFKPESINQNIPYIINKKTNADYIIDINESTFEETLFILLNKIGENIENVSSIYPQFYKPEIKKHFSESTLKLIEDKRIDLIRGRYQGYENLFFIPEWQNCKYNNMDAISAFISDMNSDRQLNNHSKISDKLKNLIENNSNYLLERNEHLLNELIRSNYFRWPELINVIPVPTHKQKEEIKEPLLSYIGFLNIKDKDISTLFKHFHFEQIIGTKQQQGDILNQFLSPHNQYSLLHHGSYVKSNFSLTLKNMHDYIKHIKQTDKLLPEFLQFLTFISEVLFRENHNQSVFTENLSFPLYKKITDSSIFVNLKIITKLKSEEFKDIENILRSNYEQSILNNVLFDKNNKNSIKQRL